MSGKGLADGILSSPFFRVQKKLLTFFFNYVLFPIHTFLANPLKEVVHLKRGILYRAFIYFLCFSFLLMMNGFARMGLEAKEIERPFGEMVSKGEVKFEARENMWKKVDSSHFPLFKGMRVKTESGQALLRFQDNGRVEVSPRSLFSIDQQGRLVLTEGSIRFSLPVASEVSFKVGNLSIQPSRTLQASKGISIPASGDSTIAGTLSIHSNGSVTISSQEGKLQVLGPDQVLLAAIPKNESITLPSVTVSGPQRVMVAQAGETAATTQTTGTFLGISTWGWVGIVAAAAVIAGVAIAAGGGDGDSDRVPICP